MCGRAAAQARQEDSPAGSVSRLTVSIRLERMFRNQALRNRTTTDTNHHSKPVGLQSTPQFGCFDDIRVDRGWVLSVWFATQYSSRRAGGTHIQRQKLTTHRGRSDYFSSSSLPPSSGQRAPVREREGATGNARRRERERDWVNADYGYSIANHIQRCGAASTFAALERY